MIDKTSHVFVVGPSRSGTALTRSVLNAHPEVLIAGETHWFDDLRTTISHPGAAIDAETRARVETHFLALTDRPFGHDGDPDAGWLDRDTLRDRADSLGGSADAYFDAFLALAAEHEGGASILGEKTPRHVFRVDAILSRFEAAKVVVMVRDPRAVVASYKDWYRNDDEVSADEAGRTRRTYDPTLLATLWRAQARAGTKAAEKYPSSVMVQRYEDLVVEPDSAVRAIAGFVGIDFVPEMLNVPLHNSSYSKTQWDAGISTAPIDRWQKRLDPAEVSVVELVTRSELKRHGYSRLELDRDRLATARLLAGSPYRIVRAMAANRGRMGNPASYMASRVRALIGR